MKILLFHYFGYGGGKFITNCLSFSKRVAIQNFDIALRTLENKEEALPIEQTLLMTIPPKENSLDWWKLEQGCVQLFGAGILEIKRNGIHHRAPLNNLSLLNDVWLPLVTHSKLEFDNVLKFFSASTIVKIFVDTDPTFIDLAMLIKSPNFDKAHSAIESLSIYKSFYVDILSCNFDFVFQNWNPLIAKNHLKITDLANMVGCNFDLDLAKNYIKKYVDFHTDRP